MKFSKTTLTALSLLDSYGYLSQPQSKGTRKIQLEPQFAEIFDSLGKTKDSILQVSEMMDKVKSIMDQVKSTLQFSPTDSFVEALLSRLEGLFILVLDCAQRQSLSSMVLPMIQYLKSWTPNRSIFMKAVRILNKILSEDVDGNPDQIESGMDGQGGWFSQNWHTLTEGRFGKRFAGALNLLIICGLLPEKASAGFNDELYKVLHVQAMRKQHPSIFHHLFSTLDWVVDAVIPALSTGNLALLLRETDLDEVDAMYRNSLDMVNLSVSGQMGTVNKKYGVADEAALVVYLIKTSAAHAAVRARCKDDKYIQKEMYLRMLKLDKLQGDIQAFWHTKGLRSKPFGVLIRGPSSVGKSTLANIVNHAVSRVMGFPEGEQYTCTLNGDDKYQSEFRSQHLCVIFDDMGNTKPEKADGNPLFVLIQFINNMHCAALSPEADKKGKNDIRAKLVIVTTNTNDLHASFFSINPASIMRRFALVVDAQLRPEACDVSGGLDEKYAGIPQPDAWYLSLSRVKIIRDKEHGRADTWKLVSIAETDVIGLVETISTIVPPFFENQDRIVEGSDALHKKKHCEHHPLFCLPCPKCDRCDGFLPIKDEMDGQTGLMFDKNAQDDFLKCYLDTTMLDNDPGLAESAEVEETQLDFVGRIRYICDGTQCCLKDLYRECKKAFKRDPWMSALSLFAGIGLAGVLAFSIFQPTLEPEGAIFSRIQAASRTPVQFVEKDDKYQRIITNVGPQPSASVSSTLEHIETKIDKNLNVVYITEFNEDTDVCFGPTGWGNSFPVGGGRWMIVSHQFVPGKTYKVQFRSHPNIGVKRFCALVNDANIERIEGTDAIVVDVPQGGDTVDFSKYMLDTLDGYEFTKGSPLFIYHAHRSQVESSCVDYKPPSSYKMTSKMEAIENICVRNVGFFDLMTYEGDNHDGMCGSMVFLAARNPILLGIHSAGNPKTNRCGVTLLAKDMLVTKKDKIFIAEQGELPKVMQGKEVPISTDVHMFSPIHYVEDDTHNLEVFGQHQLPLSKFRTGITESPLLEHMKTEMNYVPTHAAPQAKSVNHSRRRHLLETTAEKPPANPKFVKMAVTDFKKKLQPLVSNKVFTEFVHPLSYEDALNGTPGVKGMDPVNVKTSMGFPHNCPKYRCMVDCALSAELGLETMKFVTRTEVDGKVQYSYDIVFDPKKVDVKLHTEELMEMFVEGKRVNVCFRSNLKDEAVTHKKIAANKIRVFAGAPVELVIATRMLTLTLINMMTNFPAFFESAVGVDATGKDWGYIAKIITKFNKDRCGDGDFSGFDTGIRAEFSSGAFEIIKFCLAEAGFGEEELKIFDGIATECMFPVYETDGLIYKAFGSNPSGNPLTVIINGFCNSLYMRYSYYSMHKVCEFGKIPMFHHVIILLTYGDDNMFNVSKREKLFNMISVGKELARLGIKYTDASKQISLIPFKDFDFLSFLKRGFNFHEVLQAFVGNLEKESIYKSLAMTHKPKKNQRESVAQICAGNLNGALRELYFHSEKDYDDFLPIAKVLAEKSIDADGFRVKDFFEPVTKDTIREQFFKTRSVYEEALELVGMDAQSGILDEPDEHLYDTRFEYLVANHFRNSNRTLALDWVVARLASHVVFFEREYGPITQPVLQGNFIYLPQIKTCNDVNFRFYCVNEGYGDIGPLFESDYRTCDSLCFNLRLQAIEIQRVRGCIKAIAAQVKYLWANALKPHMVPERSDERAVAVMRNLLLRRVTSPFGDDITNYVHSFYQGDLIRIGTPIQLLRHIGRFHCSRNLKLCDLYDHMEPWLFQDYQFGASVYGRRQLWLDVFPTIFQQMQEIRD